MNYETKTAVRVLNGAVTSSGPLHRQPTSSQLLSSSELQDGAPPPLPYPPRPRRRSRRLHLNKYEIDVSSVQ